MLPEWSQTDLPKVSTLSRNLAFLNPLVACTAFTANPGLDGQPRLFVQSRNSALETELAEFATRHEKTLKTLNARLKAAEDGHAMIAGERAAAMARATRAEEQALEAQRELTLEKRSNHLRQTQVRKLSAELEAMRRRHLDAEHMADMRQSQLEQLLGKESNTATQVALLSRQLKVA